MSLGSGFVVSERWPSRQQDILIYRRDGSVLLSIGDCVVVGDDALIGYVEVKTKLSSEQEFTDACASMAELRDGTGALSALYVWEPASCEIALGGVWQYVRGDPGHRRSAIPHVISGRGRYLLMKPPLARTDDPRSSAPYLRWRIDNGPFTEGRALLGLVAAVFITLWPNGSPRPGLPWWLKDEWDLFEGTAKDAAEPVPWPADLV
jgi:hypothetical protein